MRNREQNRNHNVVEKRPFKYKWSHQLKIHRTLVKVANSLLRVLPFSAKYGIGSLLKKNKLPYSLITNDFNIVQIGAPTDTLMSGRARGMYFNIFNKNRLGKTIIIEPEEYSKFMYGKYTKKQSITNAIFVQLGAWNEKKTIRFFYDKSHPATNFIEGTVDYSKERLSDFESIDIPSDTVDNILKNLGIDKVSMVSITTNGSEEQILEGMKEYLKKGIPYMAMAGGQEKDIELMAKYGYEFVSYDDRGATFKLTDNI